MSYPQASNKCVSFVYFYDLFPDQRIVKHVPEVKQILFRLALPMKKRRSGRAIYFSVVQRTREGKNGNTRFPCYLESWRRAPPRGNSSGPKCSEEALDQKARTSFQPSPETFKSKYLQYKIVITPYLECYLILSHKISCMGKYHGVDRIYHARLLELIPPLSLLW